eukprot:COSAG06_NODE_37469_length_434_cov_37.202985_1_plen_51_part_10
MIQDLFVDLFLSRQVCSVGAAAARRWRCRTASSSSLVRLRGMGEGGGSSVA